MLLYFLSSFLREMLFPPILSFSISNCNLTLWKRRDKSLHTHTQTLIHDLGDAPASVFTVNWTSPMWTPQRTLQPLFPSTLPGESVSMKQRYEQLELPLNETYQHRQSQQLTLPQHSATNGQTLEGAKMKEACKRNQNNYTPVAPSKKNTMWFVCCVLEIGTLWDINASKTYKNIVRAHCCMLVDKAQYWYC